MPIFKGFWHLWTENRGAPKTPNSTMTDLTPHLRPHLRTGTGWSVFLLRFLFGLARGASTAQGTGGPKVATRAAIYRSLRTLGARNRKKVSKKGLFLWGGPQKSPKKYPKKSQKIPIFGPFWVFFDFFGYFLGLFCGPPHKKDLF